VISVFSCAMRSSIRVMSKVEPDESFPSSQERARANARVTLLMQALKLLSLMFFLTLGEPRGASLGRPVKAVVAEANLAS
jgi:hypothetical protein